MKKIIITAALAALLGGCAHLPPQMAAAPVVHAKPVAKAVPAPVVASPAPIAKETFKKRWLHKFFIKRATEK